MKKRIFSILLCLCTVLMLFPVTALANGDATALQNLLNTSDTVTLAKDYSIDTKLIVNNTVTLDLNGHVIKMTGDDGVIHVNNNISLTLQDSRPNVEHTGEYAGLPAGGVITSDKRAASGGGVYVAENGSFTMSGGTIYDCSAEGGGGVCVGDGGSFTMSGGAIRDCSAMNGGGVDLSGGSFTMTGGTITGCSATGIGGGGGVYAGGGSFTMTGGAISGCSSNDGGGGVFVGGGSFTMIGGTISDCSAINGGDAIAAINNSTINANGGTIYSEVESFGQILNTSTSGCTEFYGEVKNLSTIYGSGTISGGIYYGKVENYGTISGGMFYGNISGSGISGKTVTFMKDGSRYAREVVADGKQAVAPEDPTKDDYIFTGWYTDEALTNLYDFSSAVTENITLYAGFVPAPYTVTYEFDYGNLPDDYQNPETIDQGDSIFLPDLENCGSYKLLGWQIKNSDDIYIYPVDYEYYPSEDMTFVSVYDEIVTLTVPFTTTVKLGGSEAPGKTTFELAVVHANAIERAYANVEVTAVVTTNGAGSYEGTMTFKGSLEQLQNMLGAGVFVQQVNAGAPNWTYDDTVWSLKLRPIELATDDVAPEYILLICPATLMTSGNGSYYVIDEENPVDEMQFTNTYTYSAPVNDTTTIVIGGEKEESKPVEENPNTGAPVAANMSTLSVLVLASAVAVLKTRKH